ncbi:YhaN family protein [Komagataeibacter sp. FNDCR2]|uniref:YhaN family protein n=1 Tax=Komagataeibacter sp. FNDCR2 TaxID=2878682 RepID=UPI001E5E271D|nr:YhaN family protein [Komagataeibacter sp. FNDCR2]MCE2574266.1 AAA family ATPase [Komagataeibacter sp. FNDCR2]
MRISEFRIIRYGAIAGLDLNFGDGHGLHVIHGPNEAGKSTCLSALSDFLFGVGHNSQAGAVFGNDQIRLEARLLLADGQELALRRRKGRTRTLSLLDDAGSVVGDSQLAPALGAMTRERFAALFGLNDETLRTGGMDLLRANGDIGRLIVEAGGGLRALVMRLGEIDARRNQLFAPRRAAEREFYKALDAFSAAQKTLKDASLGHDAYAQHCRQRDEARERKTALGQEQAELRRLRTRHERLAAALPQLHEITLLETELAAQAALADLPAGTGATITHVLDTCATARTCHAAAMEQASRLGQQITVPPDEATLASLRDPITRAIHLGHEVRRHHALATGHAEKRRAINESLASLRQRLGREADADLRQFMPDRGVLDTIRRLADARVQWDSQNDGLNQQVAQTEQAMARKQARLSSLRAAGRDLPLHEDTASLAALPAEMKRLELRAGALDQRQTDLAARLGALGAMTMEQLRTLPCPTPDAVRRLAESRHGLRGEHDQLTSKLVAAREHLTTLHPQLARLEQAGHQVTPETLAAARTQRDALWRDIRTTYLDPAPAPDATTRQLQAMALDAAMDRADTLSTQLMAEANRIAQIEGLRHAIRECDDKIAFYMQQQAHLHERMDCQWQEFIAPFPALIPHAATPDALDTFVRLRTEILNDAAQIAHERALLAEERIRPATQHDIMQRLAHRLGVDPALPPGPCVAAVTAALRLHDTEHDEYDRLKRECDELRASETGLQAQARGLHAARQAWERQWARAVQALGLPADAPPAVACDLATEWAAAPAHIERLAELHEAAVQARQAMADLARVMDGLRPHIHPALPHDMLDAANELERRWQIAQKNHTQREALRPEHEQATRSVRESEASLSRAQAEVAALQTRTQTDSPHALEQLALRLARRDTLAERHAQALHTLSRMTDGQAPTDLHREIDGRDLPELTAEIARIDDRLKELDQLRDNAVRAEQREETALRAFENNTEAPQAAARREAAITHLHQIVAEYARLTLARNLIADAIDRVRTEEQDPLVTRAGQFLRLATQGAFTGIRTELDTRNEPVVQGIRHDGGIVPVTAMSAGTRDQLFLAFRLASVETYCRSAEPLPFIADDLLVQFDDARTHTTLCALADFARTTQVLLFTHHDSIRDMARDLQARGMPINLLELPRITAPAPAVTPAEP